MPPICAFSVRSGGFSTHSSWLLWNQTEGVLCLSNAVSWNIQELQVYETVAAICAPAFSPPIMAEHTASIRTDIYEKYQNRFFTLLRILNLSIPNGTNSTLHLLTLAHIQKAVQNTATVESKFPYPWERKGKEETFTQDCLDTFEELFSLRCLFYNVIVEQPSSCGLTEFLTKWEISWDKKAEEEGCNQSRFVRGNITSFLTVRRVSEWDIQMWFSPSPFPGQ